MASLLAPCGHASSGIILRRRQAAPFCAPARFVRVQSGRAEPFNENAAQVKRLINRDRKEFLGNDEDILDKYKNEFEASPNATPTPEPPSTATQIRIQVQPSTLPKPAATPSNPFGSPSAGSNPFGAPAKYTQPFRSNPTQSAIEPAGLRPDMSPDPFTKEKGFNLFESITITQIVLVLSFSLIIALMFGTAYFVFSVGAIRLNGV